MTVAEYGVLHLFSGLGGGALGFQQATSEFRGVSARFRTLAGVDVDPAACEDFRRLTGAQAARMDLFSRADYRAFHGHEPPAGWREATPDDLRAATGVAPDVIFASPPCKGFSGLLSRASSESAKYQALNRLAFRGVWLALEAWCDSPPRFALLENVPRITQRGTSLLSDLRKLLAVYGYCVHEGYHDCGELGGLGQHRRRYLLVGRHAARAPVWLYQPPKQRVRSIGEVLEQLPPPLTAPDLPMHRMPRLHWKTWVRLALIPAGGDWRDLRSLDAGAYRILPRDGRHDMQYRVQEWEQPGATVTGITDVQAGAQMVADPRGPGANELHANKYRVEKWGQPGRTVTGNDRLGSGAPSVADPRLGHEPRKGVFRVVRWTEPGGAVIGSASVRGSNGMAAIADPRVPDKPGRHTAHLRVQDWDEPGATATGANHPANGSPVVADPRLTHVPRDGSHQVGDWAAPSPPVTGSTGVTSSNGPGAVADPRINCNPRNGMMRVQPWDEPSCAVTGAGDVHAQGASGVADPRLPPDSKQGVWVILAEDGTWHRPLTTLELAALQGFPLMMPDGSPLGLTGSSDAAWRERIGNAVPPPTAQAIAGQILLCLQMGEASVWEASATPVWVVPDQAQPEVSA